MDKDFKPVINLMLFVIILLWVFATCSSCSLNTSPAKQQQTTNIPSLAMAPTSSHGVSVAELDQDGDGTIAAQELARLQPQNNSVLATFSIIVGAVVLVSVSCAMLSRGRTRGDPG